MIKIAGNLEVHAKSLSSFTKGEELNCNVQSCFGWQIFKTENFHALRFLVHIVYNFYWAVGKTTKT